MSFVSFLSTPHPHELRKMGIGRGLGGRFFQRIGAQARPIVKLVGLDDRAVEKMGQGVVISVIDK